MRSTGLAIAFIVVSGSSTFAQTPRHLGSTGSWSTWTFHENKAKICYIYSEASSKKPEALDHGRVGFSIRRLKNLKIRTEAGLQTGYDFAPKTIHVAVDGKRFTMIPRGSNAWLRREEREGEFVRALVKGRTMTIEAVSKRGNKTSYRFSLDGVAAAMRKARQMCP
jgi:hypothetical protein